MRAADDYLHDARRWSFLIPAAGPGLRLGSGPKCLLELNGETLWQRAVRRARLVAGQVVLAVPADCVDEVRRTVSTCDVIAGGSTRHETIAGLLAAASGERLFIHDVARPFGSMRLMLEVAALADGAGAAGSVSMIDSPAATVRDGSLDELLGLSGAGLIQSPLAVHRNILEDAYRKAGCQGQGARSTVELLHRAGYPFRLAEGERENIKITYAGDYRMARMIAAAWDAENGRMIENTL